MIMRTLQCIALFFFTLTLMSCPGGDDDDVTLYTVSFETGGGTPVPPTQQVEAGKAATAPSANPSKTGYIFLYWHLDGTTSAYKFQTPVTSNITLHAQWQEEATVEYWNVSWQLNGGAWPSSGDNHAERVVKGGTLSEPAAPVKTGSTFAGWYTDAALANVVSFPYDVSNITANFTLYAKWTTGGGTPEEPAPTTLYIAGRYDGGGCCWKIDLATGDIDRILLTAYGEANDITVSNGDVYISGWETSSDNVPGGITLNRACYWKNGVRTFVTTGTLQYPLEANAITVSGNNVYVAGTEDISGGYRPFYWKNGERTTISSSVNGGGKDIFVSGSDVYVAGYSAPSVAYYWKNGNGTALKSDYSQSEANSIFLSGTDIYVAGRSRYPGDWRACYWKNNSYVSLTDGSGSASANTILVSDGKVYVAGFEDVSGTVDVACYWVDGKKVVLEESTLASIQDIALSGDKVYAVGRTWVDLAHRNGHYKAACWVNGTKIDLVDGKKASEALAIALSWE